MYKSNMKSGMLGGKMPSSDKATIEKNNKKRKLNARALNIEEKATYNEAQGGRKYGKAMRQYKRSDRLKDKAENL